MVVRAGRRQGGSRVRLFVSNGSEPASDQGVRVAFVAGRRVGGAVTRNRAKRWLREAWRSLDVRAEGSVDVVVMALPGIAGGDLASVRAELADGLSALGVGLAAALSNMVSA
jgi:ribonuclease P protein component